MVRSQICFGCQQRCLIAIGNFKTYIDDALLVPCEDEITLKILIAMTLVECARGYPVIALNTNILFDHEIAIDGPKRYFRRST